MHPNLSSSEYGTLCHMNNTQCKECGKSKANLQCEICEASLCKKCTQFLPQNTFSFLETLPSELSHQTYCGACHDEYVSPELRTYEEIMARAKNVIIFYKTQKKDIPLIHKSKEVCKIKNHPDRDEVILRLAFFAAKLNFNAMIEVEVTSERIQNKSRSYQFNRWDGIGIAAQIDEEKLARIELQNQKGQKI